MAVFFNRSNSIYTLCNPLWLEKLALFLALFSSFQWFLRVKRDRHSRLIETQDRESTFQKTLKKKNRYIKT